MGDLFVRYEESKSAGAQLVKAARASALPLAEEAVFKIDTDHRQTGMAAARAEFLRFAPTGSWLTIYEGRSIGRGDSLLFLPDAVVLVEGKPAHTPITTTPQPPIASARVTPDPIPVKVVSMPDPAPRQDPQIVQYFSGVTPAKVPKPRRIRFRRYALAAAAIALVFLGMRLQSALSSVGAAAPPLHGTPIVTSYPTGVKELSSPIVRRDSAGSVPTGLHLIKNGAHTVQVGFDVVPGALQYDIAWTSPDHNGVQYFVDHPHPFGNVITLHNVHPDGLYTIQVRAAIDAGNGEWHYGPWSTTLMFRTYPTWENIAHTAWVSVPQVVTSTTLGSSFRIPGDYFITCYHVVRGSLKNISLRTLYGDPYPAKLISYSKSDDLAILQAQVSGTFPFRGSTFHPPRVGQPVTLWGYPKGRLFTASSELKITQIHGFSDVESLGFMTNLIKAPANSLPGYSGGPLVNHWGEVVGVTESVPFDASSYKGSPYKYNGHGELDGFVSAQTLDTYLYQVFHGTPEWKVLVNAGY